MSQKIYARENLKEVRSSAGYAQKELAEELGFNYSWYNRVENSSVSISKERAEDISNKLEVDFEEIFRIGGKSEGQTNSLAQAKKISPDAEVFETIKLKDFEAVVSQALSMLENAESFWYGSGVTASWIDREGVRKEFSEAIKGAREIQNFNFKILLNSSPEVLLAQEASKYIYGEGNNDYKDNDKQSLLPNKAKEKLKYFLELYVDKHGKEILKDFKIFPHGDIRTFIADSYDSGGSNTEELMLVTDHPPIGGGKQRRWYSGRVIRDPETVRDYKYRFESLWDFSAYTYDIVGMEKPNEIE